MILIAGGTGFVGGHLIRRLRQGGIPVAGDRAEPEEGAGAQRPGR